MNKNTYVSMQSNHYENAASSWDLNNRDPVVGSFDQHNNWSDYDEYLFKHCINFDSCLDFGCGPGRNIVKYNNRFKIFDGIDISQINLENAIKWLDFHKCSREKTSLIKCNGYSLEQISDNSYDVVMSTIALQHICVHEIRQSYFKEFYRVLKNEGTFTAQMGFGDGHPMSVDYYENKYNATSTNGHCDTRVEDPKSLEKDLYDCGFVDFQYYIRPVGPGDSHSQWIFFSVHKKI